MKYTEDQLDAGYESLPDLTKDAIAALETGVILKKIARDNQIHLDQLGSIGEEVSATLYGLVSPNSLTDRISSGARISTDLAAKIAVEINEGILLPLKKLVQEFSEETNDDQEEIGTPTPKPIFEQRLGEVVRHTKEEGTAPAPTRRTLPDPYREPPA